MICIVCEDKPAQEGVRYCEDCGELAFASGPDPVEIWNAEILRKEKS